MWYQIRDGDKRNLHKIWSAEVEWEPWCSEGRRRTPETTPACAGCHWSARSNFFPQLPVYSLTPLCPIQCIFPAADPTDPPWPQTETEAPSLCRFISSHNSVGSNPYHKFLVAQHSYWFCFPGGTLWDTRANSAVCFLNFTFPLKVYNEGKGTCVPFLSWEQASRWIQSILLLWRALWLITTQNTALWRRYRAWMQWGTRGKEHAFTKKSNHPGFIPRAYIHSFSKCCFSWIL